MPKLTAAERQHRADSLAEMAVDVFARFVEENVPNDFCRPEDLLDIQHELEAEFYVAIT